MRAITQAVYGEADVLTLSDLPIPTPASDELLIEVRAAGVDQATWHLMTGLPLLARLAMGIPNPKQTTLGGDVAGVVSAVGRPSPSSPWATRCTEWRADHSPTTRPPSLVTSHRNRLD